MRVVSKGVLAAGLLCLGLPTVQAQESTGTPACDQFLTAYEACIRSPRVPEDQRVELLKSLEATRNTYRRMRTARYGPDMTKLCEDTRKETFAFMTRTYGCQFR
jgi:hypothetical protein